MPSHLAPFSLPDRYRLEGGIAAGGMAAVYAAHDTVLDRPVAVKVLAEHLSSDDAAPPPPPRRAAAAGARGPGRRGPPPLPARGARGGRALVARVGRDDLRRRRARRPLLHRQGAPRR